MLSNSRVHWRIMERLLYHMSQLNTVLTYHGTPSVPHVTTQHCFFQTLLFRYVHKSQHTIEKAKFTLNTTVYFQAHSECKRFHFFTHKELYVTGMSKLWSLVIQQVIQCIFHLRQQVNCLKFDMTLEYVTQHIERYHLLENWILSYGDAKTK